jgi:ureidoglycolate lyase
MSNIIRLTPAPLTREAFAQFGEVIQTEGARHFEMNGGKLERYYDLANIDVGVKTGGKPVISIANCMEITELPLTIPFLERHPHGSQAIFPLFNQCMMIVVAPAGELISADRIRAFYSNGAQGVNFGAGVWHLPIIALKTAQAFLIVDRGGPNKNCDEFYFDEADEITLLPAAYT